MKKKLQLSFLVLGLCVTVITVTTAVAFAQEYPSKPIRLIVPFSPGGTTDILARIVSQKLAGVWSEPMVVENKPGGGGVIAPDMVAKSAPDGYTLIIVSTFLAINHSLRSKLPYDTIKDFAPIINLIRGPNILVVPASVPAKSVQELIALAKSKPGQLNFGSGGIGTTQHLTGQLFKSMAGIDIVHIPYKGYTPAFADLLAGRTSMQFCNPVDAVNYMNSGKIRVLAQTGAKRLPSLPDIPTVAEAGIPGFQALVWYGIFGPAGIPKPIITKLNTEIAKAMNLPDVKERLTKQGTEVICDSPEQFAAFFKDEIVKWTKVVKESGARVD